MSLSIFLAQVIGCYLFFVSLAMLIHSARFKKAKNDLIANTTLITLAGAFSLLLGLLILVEHNLWVSAWPVLITLVGWFLLLQGLMRLFTPEAYARLAKDVMGTVAYTFVAWIYLAIGIVLIWAGFSQR